MRILFLSQWWQPEQAFKGLPFAVGLKNRGHEVEVLTGFPNYPSGKLFSGYRIRPWQRETMEGISILRTALYPSHDSWGFKRILNYLSFSLSSFFFGPFLLRKPDVIYVYNLVTLGPTALLMKTIHRCSVVYDIQDIWPDSVYASGMIRRRWIFRILNRWCNFLYRKIDRIVVLSPGYKALLKERNVPENKIDVIFNWDPGENDPACSNRNPIKLNPDCFNILYAGNMGKAQSLETILRAAKILINDKKNVQFLFIGSGTEENHLRKLIADMDLVNVNIYSRIPYCEVKDYMRLSDALLVHLRDDFVFKMSIPSKTQSYLAAGRPILMGVKGDAADLIMTAKAGLIFEPGNAASLVEKIKIMMRMPKDDREKIGLNGKAFYNAHLCFQTALDKYIKVFADVKKRPGFEDH